MYVKIHQKLDIQGSQVENEEKTRKAYYAQRITDFYSNTMCKCNDFILFLFWGFFGIFFFWICFGVFRALTCEWNSSSFQAFMSLWDGTWRQSILQFFVRFCLGIFVYFYSFFRSLFFPIILLAASPGITYDKIKDEQTQGIFLHEYAIKRSWNKRE